MKKGVAVFFIGLLITSLFPRQDIFLSLLDAKIRTFIGQVGEDTLPAVKMLESAGFKYLEMVDPFDGGPHYGARMKDVILIKNAKLYRFKKGRTRKYKEFGLVSRGHGSGFRVTITNYKTTSKFIFLPAEAQRALETEPHMQIKAVSLPSRK